MDIVLKRNDKGFKYFYNIVNQDGSKVDLTNASSVAFKMGDQSKIIVDGTAAIEDAQNGKVSYTFTDQDTLFEGHFIAEFEISFQDGTLLAYPRDGFITINIQKNVDSNLTNITIDSIAAKQGDFEKKLDDILAQSTSLPEVIDARGTFTTLGNRLKDVDQSISGINTSLTGKANQVDFDTFKQSTTTQLAEKAAQTDLVTTNSQVALKANQTDLDTQKARIDNLAANNGSQTVGNSELIDIRVGNDGKTYSSAGEAVRGQFNKLNAGLTLSKNLVNQDKVTSGYVNEIGQISPHPTYGYTEYIDVIPGKTIYFSNDGVAATARFVTAYSAKGTAVSANGVQNVTSYVVPTGINYLIITFANSYTKFQAEYDGITAYNPWGYTVNVSKIKGISTGNINAKAVTKDLLADEAIGDPYFPFVRTAAFKANEAKVRAVKSIQMYGADFNKLYSLVNLVRNRSDYGGYFVDIYEVTSTGFVKEVCAFKSATYVEPTGLTTITLDEKNGSGIRAKIIIDWSLLDTGSNFLTLMGYADAGISKNAYQGFFINPDKVSPNYDEEGITLAPTMYGCEGKELNIYFDNIILKDYDKKQIEVSCPVGMQYDERFTIPASSVTAGQNDFTLKVYEDYDNVKAQATTKLKVASKNAFSGITKNCLFIGDSTIYQGFITQAVLNNFSNDVMKVNLIGTQGTSPLLHEGYGGWKVSNFITGGPFVYNGSFDFSQYMTSHGFSGVDYVFIHLGINDVFSLSSKQDVLNTCNDNKGYLNTMINSIHSYNSAIKVCLMVTIPASSQQYPYALGRTAGYTNWRYKRNNHYYAKFLIDTFKNMEASNVYLVPVNVTLDTVNNMSSHSETINANTAKTIARQDNAVHPQTEGGNQIGDMIYSFIKNIG